MDYVQLGSAVRMVSKQAPKTEEPCLFPILKWLHVLSAIVAVGANDTYGVWLARASRQPDVLPFTLRTIRVIDNWMANPAYGLLLLTGLMMAFSVPIPLTTPGC